MDLPVRSFRDIVEYARDVIIVTRADRLDEPGPEIVYVNRAFTELTGYSAAEVLGRSPRILQGEGTDPAITARIRAAMDRHEPVRVTLRNYARNGREYWLDMSIIPLRGDNGEVTHFAAIERDVTEQKESEERLRRLSLLDPLTGAANRRAFEQLCWDACDRRRRHGEIFSLLLLDLDYFKHINDEHGHAIGDAVLEDLAQQCRSLLRRDDTLARIGGEEFCVLLPDTELNSAKAIAERLRSGIASRRIPLESGALTYTVSIGIAQVADGENDASQVMERADRALYRAKEAGRNRVDVASPVSRKEPPIRQVAAK